MALLDEELVEYWLNKNGFFCMRGIKDGVNEIDILAVRPSDNGFECWHVEVQVSFRPVSYLGGDNNAKKRTAEQLAEGVEQYIHKKFTSDAKVAKRESLLSNADWKYKLVLAKLKDETEIELLEEHGIEVIRYDSVISELQNDKSSVHSTAGNIVEILRYARGQSSMRTGTK